MTENERVMDEILSRGTYVTYADIASILIKNKKDASEMEKVTNSLKQIAKRKLKGILENKNGKNKNDGFKYKKGYEHYLQFRCKVDKLNALEGNEKKVYATVGLGLLLEESQECSMIEFECVRNLTNAKYVAKMAQYIMYENVLRFKYYKKNSEEREVTFHPQYLREYNNRWAVYGKCEEEDHYPKYIKIDCINFDSLSIVNQTDGMEYQKAAPNFYRDYFKDMIGFKHYPDTVEEICITTNTKKVHNLIKTKPFHESQEELEQWSDETQCGKFVLHIIPNIELRTKLLSYGSGITLEGNGWFQRGFKEEIKKMAELYKNEE